MYLDIAVTAIGSDDFGKFSAFFRVIIIGLFVFGIQIRDGMYERHTN